MRKPELDRRVALAGLLATVGLAAGCADTSQTYVGEAAGLTGGAHPEAVHRLGPGDKLKVTVFGEPDLSGQFEVNARGNVPIPLVGDVRATGLSQAEFREAVRRHLAGGYLRDPKVSIEILSYRPFYVHGEVKSGGEYAYRSGLRLRDAIALAGGYTYRANHSFIYLTRSTEGVERKVALTSDALILPGDNIRVPERFF